MVSDRMVAGIEQRGVVLILVLMEYGLWPRSRGGQGRRDRVLILVLMEYGLWPFKDNLRP